MWHFLNFPDDKSFRYFPTFYLFSNLQFLFSLCKRKSYFLTQTKNRATNYQRVFSNALERTNLVTLVAQFFQFERRCKIVTEKKDTILSLLGKQRYIPILLVQFPIIAICIKQKYKHIVTSYKRYIHTWSAALRKDPILCLERGFIIKKRHIWKWLNNPARDI